MSRSEHLFARILPASATTIRTWSYGIVRCSQVLDHQEQCFHADGLYSENIFGPIRQLRCRCGKFSGEAHDNTICDECGVVVSALELRSQRFGHIELNSPVVHPWWYGDAHSPVRLILGLPFKLLHGILDRRFAIDLDHYSATSRCLVRRIGASPKAALHYNTGAEAIRQLLKIAGEFSPTTDCDFHDTARRLTRTERRRRLLATLAANKVGLQDLVLETIPVIPPALRPVQLSADGTVVVDPITRCYQRIIAINRSIRRLVDRFPQEYIDSFAFPVDQLRGLERRMRRVVRKLFTSILKSANRSRLSRLTALTAGLPRAAVVPDPTLNFNECRIPRDIARQLWMPRIVSSIDSQNSTTANRQAYMAARHWLTELMLDRFNEGSSTVLFLRTPAESRGVLSLAPKAASDKAIHISPMLAASIGLPIEACHAAAWGASQYDSYTECKLLDASVSMTSITSGKAQWSFSLEALLGCYLATRELKTNVSFPMWNATTRLDSAQRPLYFSSVDELRLACDIGKCSLHSQVIMKLPEMLVTSQCSTPIRRSSLVHCTTAGRVLLNELLPEGMPFFDYPLTHTGLEEVLEQVRTMLGTSAALASLERLTRFGIACAHRTGISISLSDIAPPPTKADRLEEAAKQIEKNDKHHHRGIISPSERVYQNLDVWSRTADCVRQDWMELLGQTPDHPLFAILSILPPEERDRIGKLSTMIGSVNLDRYGRLKTISTCFVQGIGPHDYFLLARNARRDCVAQTEADHHSRRLAARVANALQNVVVSEKDCGIRHGVDKRAPGLLDRRQNSFADQIVGRVSCENIRHPCDSEWVVQESQLITSVLAARLARMGISRIEVRSPLECQAAKGICQQCYGGDVLSGELVPIGTAVGTKAALALASVLPKQRSFLYRAGPPHRHDSDSEDVARTRRAGIVSLSKLKYVVDPQGKRVTLAPGVIEVLDHRQQVLEAVPVPQGTTIHCESGTKTYVRDLLAEWNPGCIGIHARCGGTVVGDDLTIGANMRPANPAMSPGSWIIESGLPRTHPCVRLEDISGKTIDYCFLPPGTRLHVLPGQFVERGTLLAQVPTSFEATEDWYVGGIPQISRILSAVEPASKAILAEADGRVVRTNDYDKHLCTLEIFPEDAANPGVGTRHLIDLRNRGYVRVQTGDVVRAGDKLTFGDCSPRDLLRILGLSACGEFLLKTFERLFRGQPSHIDFDSRHYETILSQQLCAARVVDPGDSDLPVGARIRRQRLFAINNRMRRWLKIESRGDSHMPTGTFVSRQQFDWEVLRLNKQGGALPTCSFPWPVSFRPLLLGIDEAARMNSSFFTPNGMTTTQLDLCRAALRGDWQDATTVKDCLICGELIPAGSGWPKDVANEQDKG